MKNQLPKPVIGIISTLLIFVYSCKKESTPSEISDLDGNKYETVNIGNQKWMAENLNTTKYQDGTDIPNVVSNTQWENLITGAYGHYNSTPVNSVTYGRLYNFYAVNSGKLCPTGWHVPSNAEWTELTDELGGLPTAGGKMKLVSNLWNLPNTDASNSSGFSALPGGNRNFDGLYMNIGTWASWWSSTNGPNDISYRGLSHDSGEVTDAKSAKNLGMSIRCIQD